MTTALTTVRTRGNLHGQDIRTDARTAEQLAQDIARAPITISSGALAYEEIRRARRKGRDTSPKIKRTNAQLKKLGCKFTLEELAAGYELAVIARQP